MSLMNTFFLGDLVRTREELKSDVVDGHYQPLWGECERDGFRVFTGFSGKMSYEEVALVVGIDGQFSCLILTSAGSMGWVSSVQFTKA